MRIARAGAGIRIRLNVAESHVLEQLFDELRSELAAGDLDPSDPVQQRLYPPGYDDDEAAQAFRELTESSLRDDRRERIEQCVAELRAGRQLLRADLTIDADGAERWLRVTNDLRLTFGTRLGITEDDDAVLDGTHPQAQLRARYFWLTALQDTLVSTLMG